jgi:hypothetical protein
MKYSIEQVRTGRLASLEAPVVRGKTEKLENSFCFNTIILSRPEQFRQN